MRDQPRAPVEPDAARAADWTRGSNRAVTTRAQARVGAPDPLGSRPTWSEDRSARLVILRENMDTSAAPEWTAPAVPLTRLKAEAAREWARASSRRLLSG